MQNITSPFGGAKARGVALIQTLVGCVWKDKKTVEDEPDSPILQFLLGYICHHHRCTGMATNIMAAQGQMWGYCSHLHSLR